MIEELLKELYPHITPKKFDTTYQHCKWYAEARRNPSYHVDQRNYPIGENEILPERFPLCEVSKKKKRVRPRLVEKVSRKKPVKRKAKKKCTKRVKKRMKKRIKNDRERKLMDFCKKAYGIGVCNHYLERKAGEHRWDSEKGKKHDVVFLDDKNADFRIRKKLVPDRISIHERGEPEYIRGSVVSTKLDSRRERLNAAKERLNKKREEFRWMFESGINDVQYGLWNSGLSFEELNRRRSSLFSRGLEDEEESSNGHEHYTQSLSKNPYADFLRDNI